MSFATVIDVRNCTVCGEAWAPPVALQDRRQLAKAIEDLGPALASLADKPTLRRHVHALAAASQGACDRCALGVVKAIRKRIRAEEAAE